MSDQFPRLNFPFRGVFLHDGTLAQPPETTPVGQNVRAYDASQDRHRGGSRAGISRWIDEQVSGDNPIQFLGTVTSTDAEAMGWVFEGRDFGYTGVYGGIGFVGGLGGLGGEIGVNGGGGYPSTLSYNKHKYHLELEASASDVGTGDSVLITGRFFDENGDPPNWEPDDRRTVELRTEPPGEEGDFEQSSTNFAGVATFSVSSDTEQTITYSARDVTKRKNATNDVQVTYTATYTLTISASGGTAPINTDLSLFGTISPASAGKVVRFYNTAEPGSDVGTAVTDGSGVATSVVNHPAPETINYACEIAADALTSTNTVSIAWT